MMAKCSEECPGDETCEWAEVCMCGGVMDGSWHDGHSPVSMHDYYSSSHTPEPEFPKEWKR